MDGLRFIKMHGLGNDFVVLDARRGAIELDRRGRRAIADRRLGVGCDQLITLEPSAKADVFMRIHNPDGDEAEACGNATRCIAALLMTETGQDAVTIETLGGLLSAHGGPGEAIAVDMGAPRLDWSEIPLARAMDTARLDFDLAEEGAPELAGPVAVNMGNPHVVFFVSDTDAVDLARWGPRIEHDPLFPERVNVSVATVRDRNRIRLRVWERSAGITPACGSAACATLVAAVRRDLTASRAAIALDGGELDVAWTGDGVAMTGPVARAFEGVLDAATLKAAGS